MNIDKHPIYKAIYELCHAIEELPPSKQATNLVIMAGNLERPADLLFDENQILTGKVDDLQHERDEALKARDQHKADALNFKEFVEKVSKQKPEKPDYWSSCGQCDRNIDTAKDLLAHHNSLNAGQPKDKE